MKALKMTVIMLMLSVASTYASAYDDDAFYDGVEYQRQQQWLDDQAQRQRAEMQHRQEEEDRRAAKAFDDLTRLQNETEQRDRMYLDQQVRRFQKAYP